MHPLPYSNISRGTFLIATPDIDAGIFFRSVVLVCEHSEHGSFGLIINKSLDLELPPEIVNMEHLENPRVGIRAGGAVQTNQMMLIHSCKDIPDQTMQIFDDIYLGGDIQFLQESITDEDGPNLLLCFGYAGWGGGQLEREFLDGNWFLAPATPHLLFETPPEKMWQNLLRKMGGKYATLSMIPEDLTLN
jgi:putative transcriptional regulator